MIRYFLYATLLAAIALPSMPAIARDAGVCRAFNFEDDPFGVDLYEVRSPGRTYFVNGASNDAEECPWSSPVCQARSFLVTRDQVVVNRTSGGFACGSYRNAKGSNVTLWLPLSALRKINPAPDWTGVWRNAMGGAEIEIEQNAPGEMVVRASASYSNEVTTQVGEFEANGDATVSTFAFALDGGKQMRVEDIPRRDLSVCTVRMAQLGSYLAVVDNNACGGLNVTFTGLYVRR